MSRLLFLLSCTLLTLALSCQRAPRRLPILGERDIVNGDTLYPTIPDFSFIDQEGQPVTNETFRGKIYVADFFFIHCPTICPKVKANALRIYQKYRNDDRVMLLSHSIDTKNDTVEALQRYAQKLGIDARRWKLVTGDHDAIYGIADDYFSVAVVNPDAPGGFDHSGRLILVDTNRHVRSFCDGTNASDVDRFMEDIDALLEEQFGSSTAQGTQ